MTGREIKFFKGEEWINVAVESSPRRALEISLSSRARGLRVPPNELLPHGNLALPAPGDLATCPSRQNCAHLNSNDRTDHHEHANAREFQLLYALSRSTVLRLNSLTHTISAMPNKWSAHREPPLLQLRLSSCTITAVRSGQLQHVNRFHRPS